MQTGGQRPLGSAPSPELWKQRRQGRAAGQGAAGRAWWSVPLPRLSSGAGGVREPCFPATALGGHLDTTVLPRLSSPFAPHVSHVSSGPCMTHFTAPWLPPVWRVPSCHRGADRIVTVFK